MAERTPWPAWARYTATGGLGFGVAIVTVTLAFGDVKRDASDAKHAVDEHEPRIRAVEVETHTLRDRWDRDVPQLQRGVEELLRRTPPK